MATRKIVFGNVNKAQVAIRFPNFPLLNITADQLGENMVSIGTQGEITSMLPTATGIVASPNPYLARTITFSIIKTSPLCQQMIDTIQSDSLLGDIEVTTDSSTLNKQTLHNGFVQSYDTMNYNGKDAAIGFTIMAYELINNSMFGS